MLADLIMDTRSFRQDEVQRLLDRKSILSNDDLKAFALGALNELGVLIERHPMIDHVFELRLRGKFADEFPKIVRDGNVRVVTFGPATALEHEEVEFLAFGNELVDSLVAFIRRREYPGRVSHRRIRTNDIEPRSGWFFAYALEFEGVMRSKEILPVFIGADGTPDEELAAWLLERATKVKREEWRDPAALPARDSSFDRAVSGRCRRSSAGGGSCRRAARAGVARGGGAFEGFVEPPTGGPAAERETTSAPHHVPPGRPGLRARTQMMAISYSQNPHEPPPKGQTEREVSA